MRYADDSQPDELSPGKNTHADSDLDDAGSVLGKYKKMFLLLFAMIAVYGIIFALYAAGILTLGMADCILLPLTLVVVVICYIKKS